MKRVFTYVLIAMMSIGLFSSELLASPHVSAKKTIEKYAPVKETAIATTKMTSPKESTSETASDLTNKQIFDMTDAFMKKLIQPTDQNYRVLNFKTKAQLVEDFSHIATASGVQPFIDFYYKEKEDGLFIVPTETPPWVDENNDLTIEQTDQKAVVTQQNENELDSNYQITLTFIKKNKQWLIDQISYN